MTRSITAALNPISILGVVGVLCLRYALLLLWCVAIVFIAGYASFRLGSGYLTPFLGEIIGVWAFLALFATVGMAIGEHSADFGFQIDDGRVTRGRLSASPVPNRNRT